MGFVDAESNDVEALFPVGVSLEDGLRANHLIPDETEIGMGWRKVGKELFQGLRRATDT